MKSTQERQRGNIRGLPALQNLLISIFSQEVQSRVLEAVKSLHLCCSAAHQAVKMDTFVRNDFYPCVLSATVFSGCSSATFVRLYR